VFPPISTGEKDALCFAGSLTPLVRLSGLRLCLKHWLTKHRLPIHRPIVPLWGDRRISRLRPRLWRIMPKKEQELGTRMALHQMTWLAITPSSAFVRHGSLLKLIQSSNFGETINSMPSARVLRAVSKTLWQGTRSRSKAQRPSLLNFSPLTKKKGPDSDLSISTTRIQY